MLVLAQVSDTHLDLGARNARRARHVMDQVRRLPVDALLVTGDIADNAAAAEYEQALEILSCSVPTVFCPGNHDDRATLRKVLLGDGSGGDGPVNQALDLDGLSVLLIDSTVPGEIHGRLEDSVLEWLADALDARRGVPTVLGMHHPPVSVGIPWLDGYLLREPDRLEQIVRRFPQVVAVVAGHVHTAAAAAFAGVPVITAPATINTALTPAEPADLDWDLPPGFTLHVWNGTSLTSHARVCP
ncbi:metallophosphoesterase [Actinocorallia lasiicapitis]